MKRFRRVLYWWPLRLLLVFLLCFAGLVRAERVAAADQVSYIGSPPPPVDGILLPEAATTIDAIFYRGSLSFTFTNSCFAAAANGNASIAVDASQRTISLDFDESTATLSPFCPAVFLPTSTMQLELDPLPAGTWTLEIDEMLTILVPIPAKSIVFEVAPAIPAVPAGGSASQLILTMGLVLTALFFGRTKIRVE